MQAFGIAIELLLGLVAAPVFCFVLVRFVRPFAVLAAWGFWISVPLVALSAAIGPAVACLALLGRRGLSRWWPLVAVVCWIAGATGIFYAHDAADTLYGVE
jgi:hypothetical protein